MPFEPLELKHDVKFVRIRSFVALELIDAKKKTFSYVKEYHFRRICPDIPHNVQIGRARIENSVAINIFGKRAL
ncbi:hypothetical protein ABER68_04240 [Paenibacillus alvei]